MLNSSTELNKLRCDGFEHCWAMCIPALALTTVSCPVPQQVLGVVHGYAFDCVYSEHLAALFTLFYHFALNWEEHWVSGCTERARLDPDVLLELAFCNAL
eukprot:scaffold103276_cov22-Tisochrysis_lutea.AAC.4